MVGCGHYCDYIWITVKASAMVRARIRLVFRLGWVKGWVPHASFCAIPICVPKLSGLASDGGHLRGYGQLEAVSFGFLSILRGQERVVIWFPDSVLYAHAAGACSMVFPG